MAVVTPPDFYCRVCEVGWSFSGGVRCWICQRVGGPWPAPTTEEERADVVIRQLSHD